MTATAAFNTVVKATGTSTTMTTEACSNVSGQVYQVTSASKRIIDPTSALTVYDDGVEVAAADIESIDFLFGKITFDGAYTVNGAVTVTGKYLPLSTIAQAREFSFTDGNDLPDCTVFQDTTHKYTQALQSLSMTLGLLEVVGTVYDGGTRSFRSVLANGEVVVVEIDIGGSGTLFRSMAIAENVSAGATVSDLVTESLQFRGLTASGAFGDQHAYWGFGS